MDQGKQLILPASYTTASATLSFGDYHFFVTLTLALRVHMLHDRVLVYFGTVLLEATVHCLCLASDSGLYMMQCAVCLELKAENVVHDNTLIKMWMTSLSHVTT